MSVDLLKVLSGDDCFINENIKIHQPTLREIMDFGEQQFFNMLYTICAIPSDVKSQLYDMGIDYMEISDFELFILYTRDMHNEKTKLILGDIDLSEMKINVDIDENENKLYRLIHIKDSSDENSEDEDCEIDYYIDEEIYTEMINFIRSMANIVPKVEKAANKFTKDILIRESRQKALQNANKKFTSVLHSLIISLVNTEEFPYDYNSVLDITLYQLMKSSVQIQTKKQSCALLQGSMSGFVDASKIDKKLMNWMYEEIKDKK